MEPNQNSSLSPRRPFWSRFYELDLVWILVIFGMIVSISYHELHDQLFITLTCAFGDFLGMTRRRNIAVDQKFSDIQQWADDVQAWADHAKARIVELEQKLADTQK